MEYNTIIIGSGVAGMTAALYLKRANVSVCVLEKDVPGGQITRTSDIDNYPGFISIDGPDLATKIYEQVINLDIPYFYTEALEIIVNDDIKIVKTKDHELKCKNIIIATGRSPRKLNVVNEDTLIGRGISYCAICDGSLYKDKKVAVIGGGRAALEESLYLSKICSNVTLIHRSNNFRADNSLLNEVKNQDNITVLTNKKVEKFTSVDNKIASIIYTEENGSFQELVIDGCFIYIGQEPNTTNFSNLGILDSDGYIEVDENYQTSVEGIFACGNALHVHDLVDFVTEESVLAGRGAAKYLKGELNTSSALTKTANGNGISYVVPQTYRLDNVEDEITFKFRVRKPYHMVKVVIKADDEVIRTIVKPHMLPAEMEMLKVKKSLLKECSTLTFEIKEG